MPELPRGTVSFLFTDVEGSTRLWATHPDAMTAAYLRHDVLLRSAIDRHGGVTYKVIGDAIQAAFPTAPAAVVAALEAQRGLVTEDWTALGLPSPLRVRMALHAGAVDPDPTGDYRSPVLNRLGRLLGAGHGGQVLLSLAVAELARDGLPEGAALRDLGEHPLKDLYRPERIWQLLHPDLTANFSPLQTMERHRHNLPVQLTPLIGREQNAAEVVALFRRPDVRLVTLTGPGGVGKTRLSLQVAADLLEEVPDGAWFVDLAPLTDPSLVVPAIASVLGVREDAGRSLVQTLAGVLREKRLLLVLDNFEHLLDAAPQAAELLTHVPGLRVLATSRERLALRGEREVVVPPLGLPDANRLPPVERLTHFAAVRLFIERAEAARPGFAVTNDNAPAVAEICHRLDGLPLAIELAAARINVFGPDEVLRRLGNRLGLLTGGARDLPARQRTLRNAIAWSHELLSEEERILFRRLAMFAGGWTFDSAEAVANEDGTLDVFAGIVSLVEKSLVRQNSADSDPRFGMLETIRAYAAELLEAGGEADRIRHAHLDHFLALAEVASPALDGGDRELWFTRLSAEQDNLRAALAGAIDSGEAERALRLTVALSNYWTDRGDLSEGRRWLDRALAEAPSPTPVRAAALNWAAFVSSLQAESTRAEAFAEEGLTVARMTGHRAEEAEALRLLATAVDGRADETRVVSLFEESLELFRELGDANGISNVLGTLGVRIMLRDPERAESFLREALAFNRERDDDTGIIFDLSCLADLALARGDHGEAAALLAETFAVHERRPGGARPHHLAGILITRGRLRLVLNDLEDAEAAFQQALEICDATEMHDMQRSALVGLGSVAIRQRNVPAVAGYLAKALRGLRDAGLTSGADREDLALGLTDLVEALLATGHPEAAARMLAAVEALPPIGLAASPPERTRRTILTTLARDELGVPLFTDAQSGGAALTLSQLLDEAVGLTELLSRSAITQTSSVKKNTPSPASQERGPGGEGRS